MLQHVVLDTPPVQGNHLLYKETLPLQENATDESSQCPGRVTQSSLTYTLEQVTTTMHQGTRSLHFHHHRQINQINFYHHIKANTHCLCNFQASNSAFNFGVCPEK